MRASERVLLDLWARQQQRTEQEAGTDEPTQAFLGESGYADGSVSSQSLNALPMPPLSAKHAFVKCGPGNRHVDAEGGRSSKSSQDQIASMANEHAALMQPRVREMLRSHSHEQGGMEHAKDIHPIHGDQCSRSWCDTADLQLDPQKRAPSNTALLQKAHFGNGQAKSSVGIGRAQADMLALSHSAGLLPSPQVAWPPALSVFRASVKNKVQYACATEGLIGCSVS